MLKSMRKLWEKNLRKDGKMSLKRLFEFSSCTKIYRILYKKKKKLKKTLHSFPYWRLFWKSEIKTLVNESMQNALRAILAIFLTLSLIHKLCNPLDDSFDWLIPTNHQMEYIIGRLTQDLKVWWVRALIPRF